MIDNLVITGSIGSGKSTVLKLFEEQGFEIIDADKMVASLYDHNHPLYHELAQTLDDWLGSHFSSQNFIDKKWLREKLSVTDNGFKIILDKVTPYIMKDMDYILTTHKNASHIIFEIPLLMEAGLHVHCNQILVITCDDKIREQRIQKRNPELNTMQIQHIMNQQLNQAEKIKFAHYVLDNSGTETELKHNFNLIFQEIFPESLKKQKYSTLKAN
jgi:dephospho-CoA kinase